MSMTATHLSHSFMELPAHMTCLQVWWACGVNKVKEFVPKLVADIKICLKGGRRPFRGSIFKLKPKLAREEVARPTITC